MNKKNTHRQRRDSLQACTSQNVKKKNREVELDDDNIMKCKNKRRTSNTIMTIRTHIRRNNNKNHSSSPLLFFRDDDNNISKRIKKVKRSKKLKSDIFEISKVRKDTDKKNNKKQS